MSISILRSGPKTSLRIPICPGVVRWPNREPNPPWSLRGWLHPRLGDAHEATPPARTPDEMIAHMDAVGTDAAIVLPGPLLKVGALPTGAYGAALARAYNRWLDAEWLGRESRIYGAIIAAPQDPEDAAREIANGAGHPWVAGVLLPMGGVDPLWGDRRYDAIYAAADGGESPGHFPRRERFAPARLPESPDTVRERIRAAGDEPSAYRNGAPRFDDGARASSHAFPRCASSFWRRAFRGSRISSCGWTRSTTRTGAISRTTRTG